MTADKPIPASILIVDDNPQNLAILTALLAEQGHEVRTATNGALALRAAQERVPSLILLDTGLPDLNGYQVCERLKADERTCDVPVIFVTAAEDVGDKVRAFSAGGVDQISRPFQAQEVLARVETHLALRRAQRSLEETNAQLQALAHDLGERVKDLNCLYGISKLVETPGISLEGIMQGTADLLPSGWQYPEITCARIVLEGREFATRNYRETPWQQTADILVHDERSGKLLVGYLEERPEIDNASRGEGPFLKEETDLLKAVAERLGRIIERKRAQESLARQEAELRATLYSIGDAVISTDMKGRVARMNPLAERLTGWTEAEAAGKPLEDVYCIVNEETRRRIENPVARFLREGTVAEPTSHTLLISKDGTEIPIAPSGAPILDPQEKMAGVALVFRDQTEERLNRRVTETRLSLIEYAASHTLDELLTRALDEVGEFVDSPIGFYHFVEPDQKTLSLQQWSTRTQKEFCQAEGKGRHYSVEEAGVWVDCVYEKRAVIHNDYASLPHKKGLPEGHAEVIRELVVPVMREDRVVAILGVGNKPTEYSPRDVEVVSHLADVTWEIVRQKRAEEALRQAKEAADEMRIAAEAANRAKSVFLANMSHGLRTPLNAVLGFSELMQRDPQLTAEQHDYVMTINRSGEHLLALINDVLELSKIEAGRSELHAESFDLHEMLHVLEEMFYLRAERKGLQLICERAPDVPRFVCADEGKLRQVLINLLANAVRFTHQGSVRLQIRSVDRDPVVRDGQSSTPPAQFLTLRFEVQDTGEGIAPEELDGVFDAFVQTESGRRSQMGTGLGMPISRQYVRMMGGELSVQSEVNVGTVFRFDLPVGLVDAGDVVGAEPERRVVKLRAGQQAAGGGAYRLLVVDDAASSRKLLVNLLMSIDSPPFGFDIREAANGQEAIEVWEAWQPHLIFMDMRMPVMDGREATQYIKAMPQGRQTVIIALTASAFEEERAKSLTVGCDDFIRKPLRSAAIFEALGKHLGVQYVYEEVRVPDRQEKDEGEDLKSEIAALPSELVVGLRRAAEFCDMEVVGRWVSAIREHNASLADALARLADDFAYDQILALLDGASDDGQQDG